ncbi:MAG TPA: copper amine oxidase N-terminal domain-containing protein, partial [Fimbriimonas sp.]|nr:copper amine oxidase N-terminal domain-containing protein [Fimbriimonas sp.]
MKRFRAFSIAVASLSAVYASAIDVNVNSNPVQFTDAMPIQKSGVIMVPVRPILYKMDINLEWNSSARQMTARENDNWVKVTVGSSVIDANGQSLTMEVPAMWRDGRLYVPIRFFAEALGAQVDWNKETQTAEINGRIDVSTGASEIMTANIAPALALESEKKTWYEAGDVLKFSLQANQGITPTLYLDGGNAAIPMTEEKPGFYMASYTMPSAQSGQAILGTEAPYASVPYQTGELVVSINRSFNSEPEELTSVPESTPNIVTENQVNPDTLTANTNPFTGNDSDYDPNMQEPDRYVPTEPVPTDTVPYKYIPTEPVPGEPIPNQPVEPPAFEPPMFLSPSLDKEF